jgi:hypothetical protein
MPFFATNPWLDDVAKFWVWIALTVPSTGIAFAFYWYSQYRSLKARKSKGLEEGVQMRSLDRRTAASSSPTI